MSMVETQRFLQDVCWNTTISSKIIGILQQVEPSSLALTKLAQDMGYAVEARDIEELKDDGRLTKRPEHDCYIKLIIGGQDWHVCNFFLNDEDLENEEEEGIPEEEIEYCSYLLKTREDGSLELGERVADDLCLGEGAGCYLTFEDLSDSSHLVMTLYSDTKWDPPLGGHDAHPKVKNRTLVIDQDLLNRFGLLPGDWVEVETSSSFDACIYRHLQDDAPNSSKMMTGHKLLSKVKELGNISKSDLVRSCGYVSPKIDGGERLHFTAFYEALLEAKGVSLAGDNKGREKGRRKLSYIATVQGNGNLLIGKAYTAMLDLLPGDEFEIKLGSNQIRLLPLGSADDAE